MFRSRPILRVAAVLVCAAGMFAIAALLLPHSPAALRAEVNSYSWAAPLAFVALWAVVTPALFSGTILALASGLLFGPVWGTLAGVAGGTLGALLSFGIARRLGADAFAALPDRKLRLLRQLQQRAEAKPFRSVLILRIMPGMPATWLNYAVGLTRVRALPFTLASALGAAPRVFIYAALGGSVAHANTTLRALSLSLIVGLALIGAVLALRERRRAIPAPA